MVTVLKPKVISIAESCSEGKSEGDINPCRDGHGKGVIFYIEKAYSQLQKLKEEKACVPDGIHPNILKNCAET